MPLQSGGRENDLKQMAADLDALDMDLSAMEDELIRPGVSPRRRRQLLEDIRQLEVDQRLLLNDIADMEHALEDMHDHLERLQENNIYN